MQTARLQLVELLSNPDTRVLALTGRWGTGKSHLWRVVRDTSTDEATRAALYVSLFGVRSIPETKLKLVQTALQQKGGKTEWKEKVAVGAEQLHRVMKYFHKGFDVLGELAQISAPSVLEGCVIVLDDMERKHKDLMVDEVLGFIDEYTVRHRCRFVLIFNGDKLGDDNVKVWEEMREKVVDHEMQLQTTPEEAFKIASGNVESPFAEAIGRATVACGITNIRILQRIIRATNRILHISGKVSDAVVKRTVPSIVLLAATHYKGIDDPPSFDFIQSFGRLPTSSGESGADTVMNEERMRGERWARMMRSMDFSGPDQFEPLVKEFLDTGMFGDGEIEHVLGKYVTNHERATAIAKAEDLKFRITWDAATSDTELLSVSRTLMTEIHHLAPGQVSTLYSLVATLPGGHDVAENLVDTWVKRFNATNPEDSDLDAFYAPVKDYHPKVVAACIEARRSKAPKLTIFDAVERIARTGSWGSEQEFLNACSVSEFKEALTEPAPARRRLVVVQLLEMGLHRSAYAGFAVAIDNFLSACADIASDPASGRLGQIIAERMKLYENKGGSLNDSTRTRQGSTSV